MRVKQRIFRVLKLGFLWPILALPWAIGPVAAQQKNLTPEQQKMFLAQRISGLMPGTFDSVCSSLYAFHSVAIHTNSDRINRTQITPTFPGFYRPTWKEVFDLIAWQTRSTWNYDPAQGFWVFRDEGPALPYRLNVANGWRAENHSMEVVYRPPKLAPVGMDVYWLGSYSMDPEVKDAGAQFAHIREELAMGFLRGYVKGVGPEQMTKTRMGKAEALYFETATERGPIWRQWVMLERGQALAIVSSIRPEHEKELLPDVLAMVNSFEIADSAPVPPSRESSAEERSMPLVREAIGLASAATHQDFAGYMAIFVEEKSWLALTSDSDLGPFLKFKEAKPGRNAVYLFSRQSPAFFVYFDDDQPFGIVTLASPKKGALDNKQIEAVYKSVTPQTKRQLVKTLTVDFGTINSDAGQPLTACQIKKAELTQ